MSRTRLTESGRLFRIKLDRKQAEVVEALATTLKRPSDAILKEIIGVGLAEIVRNHMQPKESTNESNSEV